MKNIILVAFIFIISFEMQAQNFVDRGDAPYGIELVNLVDSTGFPYKLMFNDMDGDGDMDLFHFGIRGFDNNSLHFSFVAKIRYFLEYQENVGDKYNPQFAPRKNAFDSLPFPTGTSFMIPTIGHLNGDDLSDLFICSETNEYEEQFPLFYLQNPDHSFNKSRCTDWDLESLMQFSNVIPNLVDLDSDGDLDIIMTGDICVKMPCEEREPVYYYAKNIGSPSEPEFLGWFENPYGLAMGDFFQILDGGDFDMDGDMDILSVSFLENNERLDYFENLQELNGKPAFEGFLESPFNLPTFDEDDDLLFPGITDIDGDGDVDLFIPCIIGTVVDTTAHIYYYENMDCELQKVIIDEIICEGESYIVNDIEFTEMGQYFIEEILADGCKKITELNLEVLSNSETYIQEEFCEGEIFVVAENELTQSGHYEYNLVTANGCDSLIFADLIFHEITITEIEEFLCEGEVFVIGEEEFTQSGEYQLILTDQNGCDSLIIANLDFQVINKEVQQDGAYLTAHYSDQYSYQWFNCDTGVEIDTATHNVFRAPFKGSFAVRITDIYACYDESECFDVDPTNVSDMDLANIELYPNPTIGSLTFSGLPNAVGTRYVVIDHSGRIIQEGSIRNHLKIDLSDHKNGLYYIKIHFKDKFVVKEIIKMD